ncbi:MAG: GPP34 family phosphoprotein [Deltaproteobacteria bacterium]|nr:GPP34 family phosphoprotein [Deltaproteobacteria bacterium]
MAGTITTTPATVSADAGTLRLQEELLLLALDDEKGVVSRSAEDKLPKVLARAILAELRLEGRVIFEGEGSRATVRPLSREPLDQELMDACLAVISQPGPAREVSHWLETLPVRCDLGRLAAEGLCSRGVLSEEKGRFLLVFSRPRYPERDPKAEVEVRRRLRDAVFTDLSEVDLRTSLLAGLAHDAGLLDLCFDPAAVRERSKRLERLMAGEHLGRAASKGDEGAVFAEVVGALHR